MKKTFEVKNWKEQRGAKQTRNLKGGSNENNNTDWNENMNNDNSNDMITLLLTPNHYVINIIARHIFSSCLHLEYHHSVAVVPKTSPTKKEYKEKGGQ